MSKYDPLWGIIKSSAMPELTFEEVRDKECLI